MAHKTSAPPPSERLERTTILHEIFDNCDVFRKDYDKVDYDVLKSDVLKPVLEEKYNPEVQTRGYLRTLRRTPHFRKAFEDLGNPKLQGQISAFMDGKPAKQVTAEKGFQMVASPGVKKHFSLLGTLRRVVGDCFQLKEDIEQIDKKKHLKGLPIVYEDAARKQPMEVYSNVPFENWGQNVKNKPSFTFLPTTVPGVRNLVTYAIEQKKRLRCAGYRHSWGPIFGQDNEILISFVDLEQVTTVPDPLTILEGDYTGMNVPELRTIQLKEQTAPNKRLCRIGTSVTMEDFRRWQLANGWVLPVNTVLVEVTIGGIMQGICHGAGRQHNAIPDLVREVEYVDCKGNLQVVNDTEGLKIAAGNYGLLGILTHVTLELDAMTYAVMKPRKIDAGLAVPPMDKKEIPVALRPDWYSSPKVDTILEQAANVFIDRATNDYYSEWFWLPYQQKSWVQSWNPTSDSIGAQDYPDDSETFLQWVQGWIGGVLTSSPFFNAIPGYWQAQLLATAQLATLPPTLGESEEVTIKTALPDALHFRRGVQNMRVRDMELEIPLPPLPNDPTKPDFSIVRRAWWDVINLVYEIAGENPLDPSSPMRLLLEMRIMGESNLTLAPYHANSLGTCAIEVLTLPDAVTDKEWLGFLQKVCDRWMKLGKEYGVNIRPHLAKEWEGLVVEGMPIRRYLKEVAFKGQIARFREGLERLGERQGWGLGEVKERFSNGIFDELIFA